MLFRTPLWRIFLKPKQTVDSKQPKNIKTMKKILLAISAVALMFAGCTKDLTNDVAHSGVIERGALVEKTAIFADSRVERNDEGKLSWSEGDKVAAVLLNSDGSYAIDTEAYGVNPENGKVYIPENTAYVLYPFSMTDKKLSGTTLSFRTAHVMSSNDPQTAFDISPMKGVVTGDIIEFNNLMAFAKVPLTGTGKLKSAVLRTQCRTTSEFQPISNQASFDLAANVTEGGGIVMATTANNGAFSWMRQNYGDGIDLSTNPSLYFPLPEGEYANMGLVLVTDEGTYTIYANNKHSFARSTVKPISATPINLADHKPVDAVSLAGTTGNAAEDYASCYMVPPTAGSYKFPCTLVDGTVLKGGVTAELKWAEEAGLVYDIFYDPEANEISFKTNGKEGNALLSLTDNTANGNTIVWSWHIWITDTPKTLKLMGTGTHSEEPYYLMDRVVGATWAPSANFEQTSTMSLTEKETTYEIPFNNTMLLENANKACGVYFQYQNRNPLPRIKDLGFIGKENVTTMVNSRCDVMYGFSQYSQHWATSTSVANVTLDKHGNNQYIHNGINFPNYEYTKNNAWVDANVINEYNNSAPTSSVLVSEGNYRFWNSVNNNNHDTMMKGKTSHDPCPPGYILDNYSSLYWHTTTRQGEFGYTRAAADNSTYKSGFKFYGMYYNNAEDSEGNKLPLYLPCCGNRSNCINGVSGQYANCGYIYVVNTNNKDTYAAGDYTVGKGGAMAFGEVLSSYTAPGVIAESSGKTVNAQAYPVRCRRGKF